MAVDVKDLPPAYQAQALRKWAEQERKKKPVPSPTASQSRKPGKYHNTPTERATASGAVVKFDSQKEARRYDELVLLLEAGEIRELKLQAQFTLQEAYTTAEGVRVRAIRYQADFCYIGGDGKPVVEDVKSKATKTRVYEIKKKLMRERFDIDIQEV